MVQCANIVRKGNFFKTSGFYWTENSHKVLPGCAARIEGISNICSPNSLKIYRVIKQGLIMNTFPVSHRDLSCLVLPTDQSIPPREVISLYNKLRSITQTRASNLHFFQVFVVGGNCF